MTLDLRVLVEEDVVRQREGEAKVSGMWHMLGFVP